MIKVKNFYYKQAESVKKEQQEKEKESRPKLLKFGKEYKFVRL